MPNLTAEQATQLIAIVEAADENDARKALAVLGGFQPLPGRSWTEFNPRSVGAFLLSNAGYHIEAVALATRAATRHGLDDLSGKIIEDWRRGMYAEALVSTHHKRSDSAKVLLNVNIQAFSNFLDVRPERSLLDLISFTEVAAKPAAPKVPPTGRPTVVSLCVWGERFIDTAAQIFLPSCLAPANFPRLKEFGTVYVRINTRAEDIDRILLLPVVKELSAHAQFEISAIPENLLRGTHLSGGSGLWNRMLFSALNFSDLAFARDLNADVMIGAADVLPANNCFSAAKQLLVDGYDEVVVQPIRAGRRKILSLLEARGLRSATCFDIPSDVLYRASLEAIHPFIANSFMRNTPVRIPMDPVQFYFPTMDGFSLRTFQMNIFAANAARLPADMVCDFHTHDTRLLSDLLIGHDRLKACYIATQMPGDVYFVSIDDEEEGVATFGDFEMSPAQAVSSIQKWIGRREDIDHFIWTIQQKFSYRIPAGVTIELPNDCRDEEQTVAEIVAMLEEARPNIERTLQAYAR